LALASLPKSLAPQIAHAGFLQHGRVVTKPKKKIPDFKTEAEEREFWESHDSSDYLDRSQADAVRLPNLKTSTKTISLRLPVALLERIKLEANERDMPYQSLIKAWLAEDVGQRGP
jgi:predicted DNA binding CopG/RHH family protein